MSSLYIHIPFCAKRCFYCDFHSGTDNTLRDKYVDALTMELKMRIGELPVSTLNTIYIGGGTPSQLTPLQLKKIFSALEQYFNISQVKEITIEVNPDDITKDLRFNEMMGFTKEELISLMQSQNISEKRTQEFLSTPPQYSILQNPGRKSHSK